MLLSASAGGVPWAGSIYAMQKGQPYKSQASHLLRASWPAHHWLSLWFRGAILPYPLSRQSENPCEICCPSPPQTKFK